MASDAELLREYVTRESEPAFAALVAQNINLVYFSALRRARGDSHLAEEITQQVFIALAKKAEALASHPTLAGWLFVTTRNIAGQAIRSERRRLVRERETIDMKSTETSPEANCDWAELAPHLDAALDELDDRDREAVLLRCLQDSPFAEIGRRLRLTEDAARKRVDRALERLRICLGRRGLTSTAATLTTALGAQPTTAMPPGLAAKVSGLAMAKIADGGMASAITIMKTTKTTLAAAGILTALAIGFGLYEEVVARAARNSVATLSRDMARLTQELKLSERAVASLRAKSTEVKEGPALSPAGAAKSASKTAGPSQSAGKSAPEPSQAAAKTPGGAMLKLRDDFFSRPELRQASVVTMGAWRASLLGPFFQNAAVPPETQERIRKIFEESWNAGLELGLAARTQGTTEADPALQKLRDGIPANMEAALKEALGEDTYRQYQAFLPTLPQRDTVARVASQLYYTNTPLAPDQAEHLVRILSQNKAGTVSGTTVGGNTIGAGAAINAAAIEQARGFLSPPQIEALVMVQRLQQQEIANRSPRK